MHPMEQAGCGGIAPYWLGDAQLEAGGSYPMRPNISPTVGGSPWRPYSTPIKKGLITGYC